MKLWSIKILLGEKNFAPKLKICDLLSRLLRIFRYHNTFLTLVGAAGLFLAHDKKVKKSGVFSPPLLKILELDHFLRAFYPRLTCFYTASNVALALIQIRCQKWLASWNHSMVESLFSLLYFVSTFSHVLGPFFSSYTLWKN